DLDLGVLAADGQVLEDEVVARAPADAQALTVEGNLGPESAVLAQDQGEAGLCQGAGHRGTRRSAGHGASRRQLWRIGYRGTHAPSLPMPGPCPNPDLPERCPPAAGRFGAPSPSRRVGPGLRLARRLGLRGGLAPAVAFATHQQPL